MRRENPGSGEHLPPRLVSMAQAQDPGCVEGLREPCVSLRTLSHPGLIQFAGMHSFLQVLGRHRTLRTPQFWGFVALGRVLDRQIDLRLWEEVLLQTQELSGANLGGVPGRGSHRVGWHPQRKPELFEI